MERMPPLAVTCPIRTSERPNTREMPRLTAWDAMPAKFCLTHIVPETITPITVMAIRTFCFTFTTNDDFDKGLILPFDS